MPIRLNQTLAQIPRSGIRRFFEIVAEQPDVISLSVGEPDFATPWHIREHAIYALETADTHYTGNCGTPELRAAIADYHRRRFGARHDPNSEILVTNGASEAFDVAIRALLNPGDEVLIPVPSYVMYAPLIQLAGGTPIRVPAGKNWQLSIPELQKRVSPRTRALVLNYPSNPTGSTLNLPILKKLAAFAEKNDLVVISDEIYAELSYAGRHVEFSALPKMKNRTLTISGVSKAWAMTGFRIGWLAGPAPVVAAATKIHQYSALCAASVSQAAAVEALQRGDASVAEMRAEYRARRDFVVHELQQLGFSIQPPAGAFYLFPNVRARTGLSGEQFALRLLKKFKVAVVPGGAFGAEFDDFVRIGYATSLPELTEAFARIADFVKSCRK